VSRAPGFGAFLAANAPFLGAGFAISFASSFGQTYFISLFAADIMADFALSDGGWGAIYAVATIASAGAMMFAGVLTDRFRVRRLAVWVTLGLAAACLTMAGARGWAMLTLAVFALRFFGQGMMSHMPAVAIARWFVAARGKALAISATGFATGQAILPIAFVSAGALMGWRWLWVVAACLVLTLIPAVLALLRTERTPQSIATDVAVAGLDGAHWTRAMLLRAPLFWALVPLLLGPPAFGTALFFHQVHMVDTKGWELAGYVALMPVFVSVSVTMMFAMGLMIDRVGSPRLMLGYLLPFAAAFTIMAQAQTLWGAAAALIVLGFGTGAQNTLLTACWAELFGTRHLGAVKALITAIMVLGSALGPGLTGWVIDLGIPFENQLWAIALYMLAAQAVAATALWRALPRLGATALPA